MPDQNDIQQQLSPVQQQLLEQLHDIHMPEAISWWPLASGWWLLIAFVLAAITLLLIFSIHKRRRNHYRKVAINELNAAYEQWQKEQSNAHYLQSSNSILKRTVLHLRSQNMSGNSNKETNIASLTGSAWVDELNRHSAKPLSDNVRNALGSAAYQANPVVDIEELQIQVSEFIKTHRFTLNTNNTKNTIKETPHA